MDYTPTFIIDTKQCHVCSNQINRDYDTGPGKWYWCNTCGDYTTINDENVKPNK